MNKKRIIYLAIIIIILISIFQILLIPSGRNVFDYIFRAVRGEYATYIRIADKEEKWKTVYCNGEYYIYSKEKKAICRYSTWEKIVPMPQEPEWMTASDKYIIYSVDNILYQYSYDGIFVASRSFSEHEQILKLYTEDENVYCSICTGDNSIVDTVYILSVEDISKAGNIGRTGLSFEMLPGFCVSSEKFMREYRIRQLENGWIVAGGEPGTIKIDYKDDSIKIWTSDTSREWIEIVGGSERTPVSERYDVLCMDGNVLYAIPEGRECMIASMEQSDIIEYKNKEFRYSYSVVDDRCLIILLEKYLDGFGGDGRPASEGSVGSFFGGCLLAINLDNHKLEKSIEEEEQVIYIDKDRYATLNNGVIKVRGILDEKKIKEKKIKGYKRGKEYNIELCHNRLFVFCGDDLLDTFMLD